VNWLWILPLGIITVWITDIAVWERKQYKLRKRVLNGAEDFSASRKKKQGI